MSSRSAGEVAGGEAKRRGGTKRSPRWTERLDADWSTATACARRATSRREDDVHDYVVRCAAGDNQLSLALQAAGQAAVSVTTPTATLSIVSESVSITLSEDDPLIVRATVRGGTQNYWVRCLPHDFPAITFASHAELGAPTPGWYLTGNATVASGESGFAMILDGNGTPVWYQRVGPNGVMNVDRLPDGTLSYVPTLGPYGSAPNAQALV